jgi:dTDP-4-dehydrorhamnose reductase
MSGVLVTGAGGLLGRHLIPALRGAGFPLTLAYHRRGRPPGGVSAMTGEVDVTDGGAVRAFVAAARPEIIIHTAALTNVDGCERHPEDAWRVNVCGTNHVARAAAEAGAHLVLISTDYVFDGRRGLYVETDPPNPVNWYGLTKVVAEVVARAAAGGTVVRTSFYGPRDDGRGLYQRVVDSLGAGRAVTVDDGSFFSPLPVTALARAVTTMARLRPCGTYHVAGAERCSRHAFAVAVARAHGLNAELVRAGDPARPAEAAALAPRPADVSLAVDRSRRELGLALPSLTEGLRELLPGGEGT